MALINCADPASKCYPASGEHVAFISVKFEELRVTPSKSTESEVRENEMSPTLVNRIEEHIRGDEDRTKD